MMLVTAVATAILNILIVRTGLYGASGIVFMLILLSSFTNIRQGEIPLTFILIVALYLVREFVNALTPEHGLPACPHRGRDHRRAVRIHLLAVPSEARLFPACRTGPAKRSSACDPSMGFASLRSCLLRRPLRPRAQAEEKDVTVPISSLVLFTSGVGYFQHDGAVDGNARMELTFSASQINDLLKSLVLRDLDGGSISSVTYSSRDPITRTLKSFSLDLTSNPSLTALLTQTRGEPVEVSSPAGTK